MDKISIAKVCQHMEIVKKQHHIITRALIYMYVNEVLHNEHPVFHL